MRRVWLISFVLFLATFGVFSRVLLGDFVQWDDGISVYQNPHIQGLDWARLRWMFSDASYAMRYKPLTWLTYALVYQLGGLRPLGYHLANLLIHCCNTVLLFGVIRRLLAAGNPGENADARLARATFPAAGGALLWAINPLRVEPVARVTDLTFCLLLCFLLISLWCYLRACGSNGGNAGRSPFYWGSVAAFALAMFSFPFAFAYGVVLLVLDWYPLAPICGLCQWVAGCLRTQGFAGKDSVPAVGRDDARHRYRPAFPDGNLGRVPCGRWLPPIRAGHAGVLRLGLLRLETLVALTPLAVLHHIGEFQSQRLALLAECRLCHRDHRCCSCAGAVSGPGRWRYGSATCCCWFPPWDSLSGHTSPSDRYDYLPGLVWAVAIAATLRRLGAHPSLRAAVFALGDGPGRVLGSFEPAPGTNLAQQRCPVRVYDP